MTINLMQQCCIRIWSLFKVVQHIVGTNVALKIVCRHHQWRNLPFFVGGGVGGGGCRVEFRMYISTCLQSTYIWTKFLLSGIRSVQDNVATSVTAMMVTVSISTDALSSVFISPDLSDTNRFHQCCWSIMPVTACSCRLQQSSCSKHTCIILLHQTDTALTTQQTVPVWYRQFWTVCWRQQSDAAYDIIPVSGLKVQQAVTGLWCFCVCIWWQSGNWQHIELKITSKFMKKIALAKKNKRSSLYDFIYRYF